MDPYEIIDLTQWNPIGRKITYILVAVAGITIFTHLTILLLTRSYKNKYDYINRYEIRLLWYVSLLLVASAAVFVNTLALNLGLLWLLVQLFVTVMMGLIAALFFNNVLRFYYPFYIEKRLKKLRYKPRLSPKSGKPMKLLTEDEEDVYLDEGMQAEENVFSIDYDVWIDDDTGYTLIEKYRGHLHALQCPECNYQTLKVTKEEILESPTENEEGELMKFFQCDYCKYKERRAFKIAKLKVIKTPDNTSKEVSI